MHQGLPLLLMAFKKLLQAARKALTISLRELLFFMQDLFVYGGVPR